MKIKNKRNFNRYSALLIIMTLIFTSILSRIVFLQVVKGEDFKAKADSNSIREIPEAAPRGKIFDSNGSVLATNTQSYVLVYNQTDESDKTFFQTMDKVFKILDENGETQQDDFELKINPYRFEFRSDDPHTKKNLELRFKKDRGLDDEVIKKLFKGKKKDQLTEADNAKVDEELLKITPEETFKYLVKKYKIDDKKYTLEQQRRFMIIKDTSKMNSFSGYKPVTIASNIKKSTALVFLQMLNELPGIDVNTEPIRTYPNGELGSAFLGYISKITSDDDKYSEKGYDTSTDYIGAAGLESGFEDRLKGSKGGKIVKLNKQGRIIEELGSRDSYPGQSLGLTIDKDVQAAAEKALDSKMAELRANPSSQQGSNTANATRGAAVVLDVNTGGVIALASRPGYDPNLFSTPGGLNTDLYNKFFNPDLGAFGKQYIEQRGLMAYYPGQSEDDVLNTLFPIDKSIKNNAAIRKDPYDIYPKPFYNYATQSLIPPGSTFKPMTAIAGLQSGVITPGFVVDDEGVFDKGGGHITQFKLDGANGPVDLISAIQKSSNPYFMTVGKLIRETIGSDGLAKYAWKFGLGVPPNSNVKPSTGIEIPEAFGQVFNMWSMKNLYANTYLYKTMETLKSGGDNGFKFTPIDLYDDNNDSSKVKDIKKKLKQSIQDAIKNGNSAFNKDSCSSMLTDLIQEDPKYKDKNISDKDIKSMISCIYYITVSDANSQINVGAPIYDASIGQGMDQFTPLQIANYIATLANGGTRYKVHLVDKILNPDGKVIEQNKPEVVEKTGISPENIAAVKAGMAAVNEKGTAAGAFQNFPIPTAGKTGTASMNNQEAVGRTDYSVYVGFAPLDNPKIAVCIVMFDGGQGAQSAYIARDIYSAYFKLNNNSSDQTNSGDSGAQTNSDASSSQANSSDSSSQTSSSGQ
ncbi:penicillin-binding transpeptidase domain-containing protein [Clostridium sp. JN-1]|uniref:penicillin-binding transpeptidase domain-containing protein n=1 Tax=Clostridium sp. JN-1 TaxID=2483110 RepID=UPI000F0B41E9|nr:penicillin-binding transpeptidase domain-containing protein [Clostridium sp. JN-1]